MKNLMGLLLVGWALVLSPGFRTVAAGDQDEIPLSKLAGTYSATAQGSVFVCSTTCSTDPTGVPIGILHIGSITFDANGNACATLTGTYRHFPVDASPTTSSVFHSVTKITNYNPATGTGDKILVVLSW